MDQLLSVEELAAYLGLPVPTVYRLNYAGTGPAPIRVGRHVRYRSSEVERWLDAQTRDRSRSA